MTKLNRPMLAGGMEWLVGDTKPESGVEFSGGLPNMNQTIDFTAWLTPEQARDLGLTLLVAAGQVETARRKAAAEREASRLAVEP